MLGREVVEGQQGRAVLAQAFTLVEVSARGGRVGGLYRKPARLAGSAVKPFIFRAGTLIACISATATSSSGEAGVMARSSIAKFALFGAVIALGSLAAAPAARADTISIGLATNGGTITNEGSNASGALAVSTSFDDYDVNFVSGIGNPPLAGLELLRSNALDLSASGTMNELDIYVTESDITTPTGLQTFISSFTENSITSGWTATLSTYLDSGNGVFALTTPLSSDMFSALGSASFSASADAGPGPYSVTALFVITPDGSPGSANSTINIDLPVPEPASLILFGTGLIGLGALGRLRRRQRRQAKQGA